MVVLVNILLVANAGNFTPYVYLRLCRLVSLTLTLTLDYVNYVYLRLCLPTQPNGCVAKHITGNAGNFTP